MINGLMKKDILKIEFGILPADDFTDGGIEKAIINQIENSKIDNCYIDNSISELNSPTEMVVKEYSFGKIGDTTVAYYFNKDWLKSPAKKKRKRKPKIRKRRSF